jgi:RNA polymerase sigma-70 factor (ECF subfamily)
VWYPKKAVEPAPALEPPPAAPSAAPDDLEAIYTRYGGYVARTATRLLGSHEEVPDIVQEVFVVAAERLATVRNPEALKGWLATIAVRLVARRLRERKLRALFQRRAAPELCAELFAPGTSGEDAVTLRRLYAVLETLPASRRIAWVLRYFEGESVESVAALCGITHRSAKRRIAAAHERVREVLDARPRG